MMPHLAEEVYARLFPDNGHLVAELNWPEADPALLAAESVTIAVQVMGKLRGNNRGGAERAGGRRDRRRGSRPECCQGAGRQAHRQARACAQPHRQLRGGRMNARSQRLASGSRQPWPGSGHGHTCAVALAAVGLSAVLGGCGFQPVYMPTASGKAGVAQRELAAVYVPVIPDRPGQLLRQALQERFGNDSGTPPPMT